jgi:CRP/FNR family transcriptional regulator
MNKSGLENKLDCSSCELKSEIFKILNCEELELVNRNKIQISYNEGEVILKQGTFMSNVLSISSGLVKVYLEGESHNTILRIVRPTNFIGGPGIYYDQLHHFSVAAMCKTTVCFIDLNTFRYLLDHNQGFMSAFMNDFSQNVILNYNRLISLSQKHLAGRYADAILYLFNNVFSGTAKTINISKVDLAELSAISRESSVKILRQFQKEGILKFTGKMLEILDMEKLKMISKIA